MKQLVLLLTALCCATMASAANPVAVIETSKGTIEIELFAKESPVTVKNFLAYVNDKYYDGLIFHRVIGNFMIQGGGFKPGMQKQPSRYSTIVNESKNGLRNSRGTIAMARRPDPHSAQSQFFINVVDNSMLDGSAARWGYAVFGKVVAGMEVVDAIKKVPTGIVGPFRDVPTTDVIIASIRLKK